MENELEQLLETVRRLQANDELPARVTREQKIDWAFGNTVIENDEITRELVASVVDRGFDR